MKLKIKAILFDLVGTLIYVKDSVGVVYSTVAREYGIYVDQQILNNSFLKVIHAKPYPQGGNKEEKKWWREIVFETFRSSNCEIGNKFNEIFEVLFKEFTKKNTWAVYPDVVLVLEKLKGEKIKLGMISNFDSRLEVLLKELDLFKYFNSLSYSGKTGFSKPDPRIFQYALKELNIIPEETIYIGDSLDSDYYPALNLDINAILIDRGKSSKQKVSTDIKTISNLNQIFDFLLCHCKEQGDGAIT